MEPEECLRRMVPKLPAAIGWRFQSVLKHIEGARVLLPIDREMASFRAITAEEEAATALMMAVQTKRYPSAGKFNARNHTHKAAVIACVMSIAQTLLPFMKEYQATFKFEEGRIEVKIPLSNFGVKGGEAYAIQFVEPLGMLHSRPDTTEGEVFNHALDALANGQGFKDPRKLIASKANERNTLLYARDTGLPESKATAQALDNRKNRALILLSLAVMVLQAKDHQPMVKQAIPAFLRVIGQAQSAA